MPATTEDKRTAVNMVANLSGYLMTASLSALGAQAAILAYVIDKRTHLAWYFVVSGCAAALLVLSLIEGGKGISEIYKNGFAGRWKIKTSCRTFDTQALLSLGGVVLVAASVVLGVPKSETSCDYQCLQNEIVILKAEIGEMKEAASIRRRKQNISRRPRETFQPGE
jgi:hypothetical protein